MKRAILATITLIAFPLSAQVQRTDEVVREVLAHGHAYAYAGHLADSIGPRLAGSPQYDLASAWALEQFRAMGVNAWLQPVTVPHWVRGLEYGWLPSHNNQRVVLTALGGSVATPAEGIDADIVAVDSFEALDALGDAVKGKIVLYNHPMKRELVQERRADEAYSDAVKFRSTGASRAAAHGAVAALIRSVTTESLRTPHTGAMRYDPEQPRIPAAALTTEDAALIQRLLDRGERVRMHLVLTPEDRGQTEDHNVIAEIPGTDLRDEIVLVGGHLDSWDLATGAMDNAAGVSMVMETMRAISSLKARPRRTIRAVLFSNEEFGLSGARAYAETYAVNAGRHFAAIETDSGGFAPRGFSTTLTDAQITAFLPQITPLRTVGAERYVNARRTGADTSILVGKGVPGFGLNTDPLHYFDYHHSPADTFDKVDRDDLTRSAAAVAGMAWTLANTRFDLPRPPVGDPPTR